MNLTRRHAPTRRRFVRRAAMLVTGMAALALTGCSCEGPQPRRLPVADHMPSVRVKLGEDAPVLAVAVDGPWSMLTGAGESAGQKPLPWTEFLVQADEVLAAGRPVGPGPVVILAARDGTIRLRQPVGGKMRERAYRGSLRILRTADAKLRAVNVVPVEDYLAGVLAEELPRRWHLEAYKAQAVAARTYALMERQRRRRYDFELWDSTQSQVYGGLGSETSTAWKALAATWGVVATWQGSDGRLRLLPAYYHSTCGGATAPVAVVFGGKSPPPLAGVTCPFCKRSKWRRWKDVRLSKRDIGEALRGSGHPDLRCLGEVRRVEVAGTTRGGRAAKIRVADAAGMAVLVRANHWRKLVGLGKVHSTFFKIKDLGDHVELVEGRGLGHGVGMCQWGAEFLAARGKSGEQILRYYYPGTRLARAY